MNSIFKWFESFKRKETTKDIVKELHKVYNRIERLLQDDDTQHRLRSALFGVHCAIKDLDDNNSNKNST